MNKINETDEKLIIITWLWKSTGWRVGYSAEHVNNLQRMINNNLSIPHELICITDMPKGIICKTVPLWRDEINLMNPIRPNCFRRLKAFSIEAKNVLGKRFVSIDLDCVVLGDLTPIFNRTDDFIILEGRACHYNGSLWMMNAGARKEVWENFDSTISPSKALCTRNKNGIPFYGSDQAWISHLLGKEEKTWPLGSQSGIYQYSDLCKDAVLSIPKNARLIFFAGGVKPWTQNLFSDLQQQYKTYNK